MKKNEIVILTKLKKEYSDKNLYQNVKGVVLKSQTYNKSLVFFLNDKIVGDYAVIEVFNSDVEKTDVELPKQIIAELKGSNKLNNDNLLKKQSFKKLEFNECDFVELIVEDEKYTKFGAHKGDTGVVAIDYATENSILVDFSGIDKNGNYYGDCISVDMKDLKLIKC